MIRLLVLLGLLSSSALGSALPNHKLTPGAINPKLTATLICSKSFRTGPCRHVDESKRKHVFAEYGEAWSVHKCCEVNHLISLELGGSNSIPNLWPEPYAGQWGARTKDKLENRLHRLVRSRRLSLASAQRQISTNWIKAYKKWMKH